MGHLYLLHQIVERAAERHGDKIAVRCDGVELTFVELAERVDRLAWSLIAAGVERGDRVGILLHKSVESMVAVYGVMAAGAAYVPLDPLAPPVHLATVVSDCAITTIVSDDRSGGSRIERAATDAPSLHTVVGATMPVGDLRVITPDETAATDDRPLPLGRPVEPEVYIT